MIAVHVTGTVHARWTLCGLRTTDPRALPYGAAVYVPHRLAQGRNYCGECLEELELERSSS